MKTTPQYSGRPITFEMPVLGCAKSMSRIINVPHLCPALWPFSLCCFRTVCSDLFCAAPIAAGFFCAFLDVFILPLFFGAHTTHVFFPRHGDPPSLNAIAAEEQKKPRLRQKCLSLYFTSASSLFRAAIVNQATLRRDARELSAAAVSSSLIFSSVSDCFTAALPASFNLPTAF